MGPIDERPVPPRPARDIRAALLPEDCAAFDAAYEEALAQARDSLDLTEPFKTLVWSPNGADTREGGEGAVGGHDRHGLDHALCGDHTVERISVIPRQ